MNHILSEDLKENNRLYREMDGLYHELCVKIGLSDSAFLILYSIVETEGKCSQKEIADRCCISRKTINSSVKNLEAKEYIMLEKRKGRDKYIVLTERGEKLIKEKIIPIMEMEERTFLEMDIRNCMPGNCQREKRCSGSMKNMWKCSEKMWEA